MKRTVHPIVTELRAVRVGKRLGQRTLADQIGVTKEAVCQWENGIRTPSFFNFACWAESLGVELVVKEKTDALD